MTGAPEAINSIEWAVLFAALVLSARLYSLIQAGRGVAHSHAQVLEGLASGDLPALEKRTRGLLYRNPYGEVAAELINAAHRETEDEAKRRDFVARALATVSKRLRRRTQQGRLADALTLAIGAIVVIYSRNVLPAGPLFWSCGGAMFVTLAATFAARGLLLHNLLTSAEALQAALLNRPSLPSLSEGVHPCLWCGEQTRRDLYQLTPAAGGDPVTIEATVCDECGKMVATLPNRPRS